ncbi:MAG: glycosyltransferase family 2 protein [Deltaproteobacteria bacterium]|nr:glycosyltransferase family 2 protein [Deltaproteobacteria bacterium]
MTSVLLDVISVVATFLVLAAVIPVASGLYQYIYVITSLFSTHLESTSNYVPRLAILIPAWNEDSVIATSIDRLMALNYAQKKLRVYVIDDGSTDDTPAISIDKAKEFPGRVIHVRRVAGGEGKASTLNYGLDIIWKSGWAEAVLVMDADVIYTDESLLKMSRHFHDPAIGAVTANIKEGSRKPNYVQRFITFEYVTATGASRRAQNAFGFLACLSGGAQMHTRENLMAIGGEIFHDTLAEDTFTTFRTQLSGRKAIFEPNAIVYAEEPDDLVGLWKQRVRWGRGNVQITGVFKRLWFNPERHGGLGSWTMAFMWFSIFFMPLFQLGASISLIVLYFVDPAWAWDLFRLLWITAGLVYLLITLGSFVVDWESCVKSWVEGVMFPGIISLVIIIYSLAPFLVDPWIDYIAPPEGHWAGAVFVLFLYAWLSLAMVVTWLAKEAEGTRWKFLCAPLIYIGGYGAFLCAVTFGSYIKELRGEAKTWDKTVKTGKVG